MNLQKINYELVAAAAKEREIPFRQEGGLRSLTDGRLLLNLKNIAVGERQLLKAVIEHLEEVENRRLYLERGFSSMFAFCTGYLNYTPQEALTRIQAMRLSKKVPEVKNKIQDGTLSLSVAAKIQTHVTRENKEVAPVPIAKMQAIVEVVGGKSVRESERTLLEIFPHHEMIEPQRVRQMSAQEVRLEINIYRLVHQKLEELRAVRSNANPEMDWSVFLDDLCELALKKWHPAKQWQRVDLVSDK